MLHRSKFFLLIIFVLSSLRIVAQDREPWEVGLGMGYTNYYGDLSPYKINGLRNLSRIVDLNRNYQYRPSFSLMLHRKITPTLGFMIQANYLQIGMSDRYQNKSGNIDSSVGNYSRALNFRTDVKDIGLAFTFNANNGKVFARDAFFYPSFYLGAGVSQFTVKGDLYDANGNAYNYLLPTTINDGSFETNLRDLRTETDSRYPDIEPYVNLGLALNFRFTNRFSLAIQSDIKYSASDYLDDVSKRYKTSYASAAESYAARPGYNTIDPITLARGDNDGMNDFYVNNRVVLRIGLGGRPKPPPFSAPVIYSLAPPSRINKVSVDSARIKIVADSLLKLKTDSLFKARVDSVKFFQDSIIAASAGMRSNDSLIIAQLAAINTELVALKSALNLQKIEPAVQKIKIQADSIRVARQRIVSQKKLSEEDNLRVRLYDFQLDSLNREEAKIMVETRGSTEKSVAQDTVEDSKEIREYSEEVKALKRDDRYKTDSSFRKNVDVLQERLDRYREQAKEDAAADKAKDKNDKMRADSLQARIKYLESLSSIENQQSTTVIKSNTVETPVQKTVSRDTLVKRRYVPIVTDTQTVKKKWYQRLFSTGPDKSETVRVEETKVTPDTVTVKRKWYQRLFSTGPVNTRTERIEQSETITDTVSVRKKWYQRLFSTRPENQERVVTDTVIRSSSIPRDDEKVTDTITRKRKWYQRLFSTRAKDTIRTTSSTRSNVNDNLVYVGETAGRPVSPRDTVVETQRSPVTVQQNSRNRVSVAPVRDTVVTSRLAKVDPAKVSDTLALKQLIAESEQVRKQNEVAVAQLREQLKRSSDSAAFYRRALVQSAEVRENTSSEPAKRTIFTNRRKQEEETRQRKAEEQMMRDQYLSQQRYQSGQAAVLQRRIDDLENDNRNLSRYQNNYDTEIRRRNVEYVGTTALVAGTAISAADNREMATMREELDRLKTQVNNQDQRLRSADSAVVKDSISFPAPAVMANNSAPSDSSNMVSLRTEIDTLRNEISRLKATPALPLPPKAVEPVAPDLKDFPVVSVYFNSGSVNLSPDQAAKLVPFASAASTNKKVGILLKGFTDATGNATINKRLALQRMAAVKNILLTKYQLSLYRISTDEPQMAGGTGSKKSNPLDRRVDLLFQ